MAPNSSKKNSVAQSAYKRFFYYVDHSAGGQAAPGPCGVAGKAGPPGLY